MTEQKTSTDVVKKPKENELMKMEDGVSLPNMEVLERYANSLVTSTFAKKFEKQDPSDKTKKIVDPADILANLVLGNEMGLSIGGSLMLGTELNDKKYFSVLKGRAMGLDPMTSISKVHNIETKNGYVIALAVDLVSKALLDSGTVIDIINDYKITPIYVDAFNQHYVGYEEQLLNKDSILRPEFFLFDETRHSGEEVKVQLKAGKKIVVRSGKFTKVTSIRLTRKSKGFDNVFHYSIQDAIDAGLYPGFNSIAINKDGTPFYEKGKDNWIKHPATMLRNRVISIGGRVAAADFLQGSYSFDEAIDIVNSDEGTNFTSIAEVVENE